MRYIIFLLIAVTSCSPIYVPNLRQSPLFANAGEFQGSIQMGGGVHAQAAIAVSNQIG